ncbi:aminopeptidase P family protein [Irregularibacter muris]|uniref:Xaa-Pro aminopeptidase n=1 Tax=Irregularibacter muris TaxID=1796619 RepID=A0AAE3HGR3_9FIRM|nr:aminopeptidase P family protein [Irregularibacter muris]MCR1898298.1 aminopeptidase P family protein [Irregularibacter muris]
MKQDFFMKNRKKVVEQLKEDSIVVLFSGQAPQRSADSTHPFVVNRHFYYLTGLDQENVMLIITKSQGKVEEEIFIDEADPILEKWVGKKYSKEQAEDISGIAKIDWTHKFEQKLTNLLAQYSYENIYLDLEKATWNSEEQKGLNFAKEIRKRFPYLQIKDIYPMISELRTIKEPEEIEKIKKAIEITAEGIKNIMTNMQSGLKEYQLEAYFDFAINYLGARDNAFPTIAASGENAVILHYEENNNTLEEGELILFDLGADYQHYCADISRTFPVSGKFSERQKEIYNIVLKAELEVIKAMKPGLLYDELNKIAKKVLAEGCMKIGLIEKEEEISKYYYHGISHHLGLDVHDVGRRGGILKPGMVYTVEPGLYIEEEKIGIRIEDDVLITEDGHEVLSKSIPKTVEEIEELMK